MRLLLPLLCVGFLILVFVAGEPVAWMVLQRVSGTHSVTITERDGTQRQLISGHAAPLPSWLPHFPGATIADATYWLPTPKRAVSGGVELVTREGTDEIKRFYLAALKAGFDIRDIGFGRMNAREAAFMGIDGRMQGDRADDRIGIGINITEVSGLLYRSRMINVSWASYSEAEAADRNKLFE